ncbi:MAG: class I SAM-dependent methyltransferase [Bacteroidia bacterium]
MNDYLAINKQSWNGRLEAHLNSDFYDLPSFLKGKSSLNNIELDLLGNVKDLSILHLQCHFGQDTISLSRMGAKTVGIDLSDMAIKKAQELSKETNVNARFICSDVYSLPEVLHEKFDIVFTSYGTISWLPDLDKWAQVIRHFLKPNGQFVFAEFHPAVWMYDDDLEQVKYHYNNVEPIAEEEEGTYADKSAAIKQKFVCWNHGLGEVINSLLGTGLVLNQLNEFCYSPYPFVNNCEEHEPGKYHIKQFGKKFPLVYSLLATKK